MMGNIFGSSEANARIPITEPTDEAEAEPIRPAHRLVRINPDGLTVGYTGEVVPAKAGQLSDHGATDHASAAGSTFK